MRERGFPFLLLLDLGVWLFAADRLMEATLLPDIVAEIGGANLIGWGRTLFESASIMTGMMAAFLVRRWGVRYSFSFCAAGFVVGCLISFGAQDMLVFQAGRFLQALAGSAFVSLASISVARMFPLPLIARAGSVTAIVWGFAAFSGPLVGGLFSEFATWRTAFIYLTILGSVLTVLAFMLLGRHPALDTPLRLKQKAENFPALRMAVLLTGMMAIASAAIEISWPQTPFLVVFGVVLLIGFVWLDLRSGERRLLPLNVTRPFSRVGSGSMMVLMLSASTMGISTFGPVLLVILYGLPPIQIGFMMFTTSVGWTFGEVVFSGTQPQRERRVILFAALMVLGGTGCFNLAIFTDMIWLLPVGFLFNGIGFGTAWPLVVRREIADSEDNEKDRIAGSVHTLQRIGLALSAAVLGILVNAQGFSAEMAPETARHIAQWVVGLSLPMALTGVGAAFIFVQRRYDIPDEALNRPDKADVAQPLIT